MSPSTAASLATYAPVISAGPRFIPTGNLWVSLPEISLDDGAVLSLGVLHERSAGLLLAQGGASRTEPLIQPTLTIDGEPMPLRDLTWTREGSWLPHFVAEVGTGMLEGWYCAPVDERGIVLRLQYRHAGDDAAAIRLGWSGQWTATTLARLRPEQLTGERVARDDAWTGSRVVSLSAGLPLLSLAWRAGDGVELEALGDVPHWAAVRAETVAAQQVLTADLYVGVGTGFDGAATTALHLRRRGFEALWGSTADWLAEHSLAVPASPAGLAERINANLFFNYFFAQGDCLDTGLPAMVTSRSPHYYVCAAFWSRDAYCWTFPALLLTDPGRAREVLLASLRVGGQRLPDHALHVNGTSLYPGFELDQAAAPILAVWRYVTATGDWGLLDEPGVAAVLVGLTEQVDAWRHPGWDLYATFLLPSDDPTDHPYVTSCNALLAVAFEALADLTRRGPSYGVRALAPGDPEQMAGDLDARAAAIRAALRAHLVIDGTHGPMWAWACDVDGTPELRDEPPLGLRTLPFWGLCEVEDPVQIATRTWLRTEYAHHFDGAYPGGGSGHFPFPSGFDLANRLLDGDQALGDPLHQLLTTPMDQGLACESWDPETGEVRTGAAMASMAGLLAWTAWAHLAGQRRWNDPIS